MFPSSLGEFRGYQLASQNYGYSLLSTFSLAKKLAIIIRRLTWSTTNHKLRWLLRGAFLHNWPHFDGERLKWWWQIQVPNNETAYYNSLWFNQHQELGTSKSLPLCPFFNLLAFLMWNNEVCESGISDKTKLRYASSTARSWVEKQLKLICKKIDFNKVMQSQLYRSNLE